MQTNIQATPLITEINAMPLIAEISVTQQVALLFEEYYIPDFVDNESALLAGLKASELWRDPDKKIRVVITNQDTNRTGFTMNLSRVYSLLRRLF
jgi:hypothetical protein